MDEYHQPIEFIGLMTARDALGPNNFGHGFRGSPGLLFGFFL
jgi:hypothetical protein